jgi:hypothetical protein
VLQAGASPDATPVWDACSHAELASNIPPCDNCIRYFPPLDWGRRGWGCKIDAGHGEMSLACSPPPQGAPGGRIGGGTRDPADTTLLLTVLAPKEHTGLTVHAQPVLYWYVGQEAQHPVVVTLSDRQSVTPAIRGCPDIPHAGGYAPSPTRRLSRPLLRNNSTFIALDANPRSKDNSQGLQPYCRGTP